jgi:hypothetical protein
MVRIQVIGAYGFECEPSTKQQNIHRGAEADDDKAERRLQRVVAGEQYEQQGHQDEE